MADMTLCTQRQCPNAWRCYRIHAQKDEVQSYAEFPFTLTEDWVECAFFIPVDGENVRMDC